jgi:hypothetical protein
MNKVKNPEIRINYSWLLKNDVSEQIAKLNKWDMASDEQFEKWTEAYRMSWATKEEVILSAMQEVTGLEFYLPVIDITAVPGIIPKSHPLIIGFLDKPEDVVETITHELSHTLLLDNNIISIYGENRNFMIGSEWQKLFGIKDDFNALIHIPVHAICQKVFEDYLGDKDYVNRDRKLMEKFNATSYLKSWNYVEKVGADMIIQKLKKSYAQISKKMETKK